MDATTHPLTLTVEQAAKVLGIGRSTAYELVHTGDIPSLRLGRRLVVPVGKIASRLGIDHEAVWHAITVEAGVGPTPGIPQAPGVRSVFGRAESSRSSTLF